MAKQSWVCNKPCLVLNILLPSAVQVCRAALSGPVVLGCVMRMLKLQVQPNLMGSPK